MRDLEVIRALHRYHYLTTSQIAKRWWPGCHRTRAQVRLRRMHEARWLDRLRPRTDRGSHEWIYFLARKGFQLGQSYFRGEDTYVPRETKWRPRDAVDLDYVWHDLGVNEWMLAFAELLGDQLEDWLGPAEARTKIDTVYDRELGRQAPLTIDRLLPHSVHVDHLRLDNAVRPVFPDAAVVASDPSTSFAEVLVEYDRTGRPAKNLEKFRRYDTLLTIGWRAIERLRRLRADNDLRSPVCAVFVCQAGGVESFLRAADAEVTGVLRFFLRPGDCAYPGRNGMLFCDADDLATGSPRAWLLPEVPLDMDRGPFEPREGLLPFCAHAPAERKPVLDWAF